MDDIECQMASGATWFIQSKRVAGNDKALRDAVDQWIAQALKPDDRVALVSRELRGILRNLQPKIDRSVSRRRVDLGKVAQADVDKFAAVLTQRGGDAATLLPHVQLLQCAVEADGDAQHDNAVALLADTIVSHRSAPAAFRALRTFMQEAAARQEWTGPADWIRAIAAADIDVIRNLDGTPGNQEAAEHAALTAYRAAVASKLDRLDMSLLAPGVGSVQVNKLLDSWTVVPTSPHVTSHDMESSSDLWNVARRNDRFCLTGHPGVGKSEALRQIAARMAADPEAPLPIAINLREDVLAAAISTNITLSALLRKPAETAASVSAEVMVRVLHDAVLRGEAVLIVDGLDEARERRGAVAVGLKAVLDELPTDVGFIVSTRPSAADALRVLDLPVLRLQPPQRLDVSLRALLVALAADQPDTQRDAWLTGRELLLASASHSVSDIWKIPLLASLATVRIGSDRPATSSSAELLQDVISDSVERWEIKRTAGRDDFDLALRSDMLTDGFVAIGRLLTDSPRVRIEVASKAVAATLTGWGHPERLCAKLAAEIVHFWDERVGVFVSEGDELFARNRQFAELATVTWLQTCPMPEKQTWVSAAVEDADSKNIVQLATEKDETLRELLVGVAERDDQSMGRLQAVQWIADLWPTWGSADDALTRRIIHALAAGARNKLPPIEADHGVTSWIARSQSRTDGDGWRCVLALVRADLPEKLATVRDEQIAALDLSDSRRALVNLLAGLRHAHKHSRLLTDDERNSLESLVFGPRPMPAVSSQSTNGVLIIDRKEQYVSGVDEILELAVDHLGELREGAADALFAMAKQLSMKTYDTVRGRLTDLGYTDPAPPQIVPIVRLLQEAFEDFHGLGWLLRVVVSLGHATPAESPVERWRMRELLKLLEAIGWGDESIPEWRAAAKEDPRVVTTWFEAVIDAHTLNRHYVSAEAAAVLASADEAAEFTSLAVVPSLTPISGAQQISADLAVALVEAFTSESLWIVKQALLLVLNAKLPPVAEGVARLPPHPSWTGQYYSYLAVLANTERESAAVHEALAGSSAHRSALAVIAEQLTGDYAAASAQLQLDTDATVRYHADGDASSALTYTCTWCNASRDIAEVPCPSCRQTPPWVPRTESR
ncbi:NACHT domain-containing protein [Curtobacterium sp. Arg-1]|uniref:NACHT domain-containing protein n=1 Tax=Curtobacterium sp. Arg-1 TaxID=2935040 RepID=UPI0021D98A20|nr:NACHT domain-containing protein [Curtobacterium sp. Arg-1]UXZ56571.1 NACHT domain-containing protein [Curtobacterium sp. Arg-1]